MGRILSLDPGRKRVGVAVSDLLKLFARPYAVLPFTSVEALAEEVRAIVAREEVELVLIGRPAGASVREEEVVRLAEEIQQRLEAAGIACLLVDESFSSREAEAVIHEHGKRRKQYRDRLDQIAAAVILKEYLDRKKDGA